ncbi:hypothetical protein EDB19DRAFT_625297 [Suillus lakei]|nr:hypothetical protein EDB19DRAFT_625297 [Suillus lakei]
MRRGHTVTLAYTVCNYISVLSAAVYHMVHVTKGFLWKSSLHVMSCRVAGKLSIFGEQGWCGTIQSQQSAMGSFDCGYIKFALKIAELGQRSTVEATTRLWECLSIYVCHLTGQLWLLRDVFRWVCHRTLFSCCQSIHPTYYLTILLVCLPRSNAFHIAIHGQGVPFGH